MDTRRYSNPLDKEGPHQEDQEDGGVKAIQFLPDRGVAVKDFRSGDVSIGRMPETNGAEKPAQEIKSPAKRAVNLPVSERIRGLRETIAKPTSKIDRLVGEICKLNKEKIVGSEEYIKLQKEIQDFIDRSPNNFYSIHDVEKRLFGIFEAETSKVQGSYKIDFSFPVSIQVKFKEGKFTTNKVVRFKLEIYGVGSENVHIIATKFKDTSSDSLKIPERKIGFLKTLKRLIGR